MMPPMTPPITKVNASQCQRWRIAARKRERSKDSASGSGARRGAGRLAGLGRPGAAAGRGAVSMMAASTVVFSSVEAGAAAALLEAADWARLRRSSLMLNSASLMRAADSDETASRGPRHRRLGTKLEDRL